jgi:hypothetical protein
MSFPDVMPLTHSILLYAAAPIPGTPCRSPGARYRVPSVMITRTYRGARRVA